MISDSISIIAEKKLSKNEIKTFLISSLGGALEFYDFVVYIYFSSIISKHFFDLSSPLANLILTYSVFATGYLARILGGLIFSHYGDLSGRKNSFTLTVFLMAAPTFFIGLLPTYSHIGITATFLLFICRFAQGLAIGGEIPCSITFIYEHAQKSFRGLAVGLLFSGIILGIFLGSSAGYLCTKYIEKDQLHNWGWRIPFILGGILGLIGVYLRKYLTETPVFIQMNKENIKLPIKTVFKYHKFSIFQTASAIWLIAVAVTLFLLYLPNYFITYYNYNIQDVLKVNTIAVLLYSTLIILFGILCDLVGEKKLLIISSLLFIVFTFPIFSGFKTNNFIPIYICYGFVAITNAAATASSIYLLAKSFPVQIRYSGTAFSYNLAFGVFGGFTPLICTTLIEKTNLKNSPAFYMIAIAFICLILNLIPNRTKKV